MGEKTRVLKGPLGMTYAAATVAQAEKNLLSVSWLADGGCCVVFSREGCLHLR